MLKSEAEELLSYILLERTPGHAHLRQLGNQEWVVILRQPATYHLWSFACWQALRQQEEDERKQKARCKRAARREESYQVAIDYGAPHQVAVPIG